MTIAGLSYDDLKQLSADHYCGECGGFLTIAWINGEYVLRCRDLTHRTITRHDKQIEKLKGENRMITKTDSVGLMAMDEPKMLIRIGMAKFPQELTLIEKKLLAKIAVNYGLDPLTGEVTIYQGRPYVSIDGRYRKAQETNDLDGVETRPANKDERTEWQIPEGDYFFKAEIWKKGCSRPFVGWGRVRKGETTGGKGFKPVETNPQRMAEKRAEAQGLRKGFHIPLPSLEDAGTPEDAPLPGVVIEGKAEIIDVSALTLGKVLDWVSSHGKLYTREWFYKNQSFKETDLVDNPANLEKSVSEICTLTNWEGMKL